jgi:hypothetical protein
VSQLWNIEELFAGRRFTARVVILCVPGICATSSAKAT